MRNPKEVSAPKASQGVHVTFPYPLMLTHSVLGLVVKGRSHSFKNLDFGINRDSRVSTAASNGEGKGALKTSKLMSQYREMRKNQLKLCFFNQHYAE